MYSYSCILCSVYPVFIVPNGTLRLSWLRFFHAFSSGVRQMTGYTSQHHKDGARSAFFLISELWCSMYCFALIMCCSMYFLCVNMYYCHWVSTQLQLNVLYHIILNTLDSFYRPYIHAFRSPTLWTKCSILLRDISL